MIPKPIRQTKLSESMRKVLRNLINELPAGDHLRGQSEHGGFTATARALVERGLMTWDYEITDAGRAAINTLPTNGVKR